MDIHDVDEAVRAREMERREAMRRVEAHIAGVPDEDDEEGAEIDRELDERQNAVLDGNRYCAVCELDIRDPDWVADGDRVYHRTCWSRADLDDRLANIDEEMTTLQDDLDVLRARMQEAVENGDPAAYADATADHANIAQLLATAAAQAAEVAFHLQELSGAN